MAQEATGRATAPAQSQSLYRKYRPTTFAADELVGQEHIARTLRNAIALDRIAHAYLFCGPRGTGKTTTARLLAKAVNCLDPDPARRPCNACAACVAINTGASVDIIEIDAASNRGVDDIRDLREKVKYAPSQLRVKFYIIDEAHQLTRDAFNAFLKTLEEPPGHVKFVLATTEADKLPETVASRCQRFDFRRIPLAKAVDRLRTVCEREGFEVEDDALWMIARQATGSLRDALGLLDQLALYGDVEDGRPKITAEAVRQVLGLTRNERLAGLVDALADRDPGAGLRLIAEAAEAGEDIHQLNRQLVSYLRMLLHLLAGGREPEADDGARRQAERFTLPELAGHVKAFSSIEGALNRGSYAQLPLELALVEAIVGGPPAAPPEIPVARPARRPPPGAASPPRPAESAAPSAAPDERPSTARQPESRPAPTPAPPTLSEPVRRAAPGRVTALLSDGAALERLVTGWTQVRRDVKMANSRIAALLVSVDPVAVRTEEVVLSAPYEFHRNKLNEDAARRVVEEVISRFMGASYRLTCVTPEEAQDLVIATTPDVAGAAPTARPAAPEPNGAAGHTDAPARPPASDPPSAPAPEPGPERDPAEPSDDEQRLRAAKSIFGATELES